MDTSIQGAFRLPLRVSTSSGEDQVPALEAAEHPPAATELTGDGGEQHRHLHPVDWDRRRPRPPVAGGRVPRLADLIPSPLWPGRSASLVGASARGTDRPLE